MKEGRGNYLRMNSGTAVNARTYQRYVVLRRRFKLPKGEAWKLARALERWWERA